MSDTVLDLTQEQQEEALNNFLEQQGPYFHVRLMRYWQLSTNKREQKKQKDTDTLHFDFEQGRYSINFLLLKQRADAETILLLSSQQADESLNGKPN